MQQSWRVLVAAIRMTPRMVVIEVKVFDPNYLPTTASSHSILDQST